MRRVVTVAPHQMVVQRVDDPIPGAGEVLIEVEAVGVCGSDFHIYEGRRSDTRYPQVQGHEVVGIIRYKGPGTVSAPPVGTRVAVEPIVPCGKCFACQRGFENCCSRLQVLGVHLPGGFAELMIAPAHRIHSVGDLDADIAVLIEPISIGLQAVSRANVFAGDAVVVMGAGSVGRAVILAAAERGARVLVVDRVPMRLALALQLGAERAVNSNTEDLAKAVEEFANGDGAAIVIEATGASQVIRIALDIVAPSGTVVIVGVSEDDVSIPIRLFTNKEINLLGSRNSRGVFAEAVMLVSRNRDRLRPLVSHRFALPETERALIFARDNPAVVTKTIIEVQRPAAEFAARG